MAWLEVTVLLWLGSSSPPPLLMARPALQTSVLVHREEEETGTDRRRPNNSWKGKAASRKRGREIRSSRDREGDREGERGREKTHLAVEHGREDELQADGKDVRSALGPAQSAQHLYLDREGSSGAVCVWAGRLCDAGRSHESLAALQHCLGAYDTQEGGGGRRTWVCEE